VRSRRWKKALKQVPLARATREVGIMRIDVKVLTGPLSGRGSLLELPDGASGEQLLKAVGMEDIPRVLLIVNGRRRERDVEIHDGDAVSILTPIGGG
jgi:sulfur carrier protein ThiS